MLSEEKMNKIQELVKESLPSAVAEELRNELNQIVELKNRVKTLEDRNEKAEIQANKKDAEIRELNQKIQNHAALDIRENKIAERERKLEIDLLNKDISCANKIAENAVDFVTKVLRNTEYREQITGNIPVAIPGSRDCTGYVNHYPTTTDKTTVSE